MKSATNLEKALYTYLEIVEFTIKRIGAQSDRGKSLQLVYDRRSLVSAVEELEKKHEFQSIVEETISFFSEIYHQKRAIWHNIIKTFFRRSGYYIDIFEGKSRNIRKTFEEYCNAIEGESHKVYLAPMSFVHFNENIISFDDFTIQRYSKDKLKEKFIKQNKINEVFYPWAVIEISKAIEEKLLDQYWFIEYKMKAEHSLKRNYDFFAWNNIGQHNITPKYPELKNVLEQLVLFDWEIGGMGVGLDIPFLITENLDLLDYPRTAPLVDLSKLKIDETNYNLSGKYLGPRVFTGTNLDRNETFLFKAFISDLSYKLSVVRSNIDGWYFFDIALNFLVRYRNPGPLGQVRVQ